MKIQLLVKNFTNICVRHYSSSRNLLEYRKGNLFQDVFPDTARAEIADLLHSGQQCVYAGFDPTADSLHVGNLLVLVNLLQWQRAGHRTIAVIGGATAQIGDPSGRSTDRPELAEQKAEQNAAGIQSNIEAIFKNHENIFWRKKAKKTEPLAPLHIVNNLNWYRDLDLVSFISNIGRHFRVGTMLSRHSVETRMASESGINFTEFSYQVFQAYDWLHLLRAHDCKFQVGGNDQMGNIVSGHFLISRAEKKKVYGMTLPLVTTEAGNKFGKTAGNAIWLNPDKTSPFELYQFFIRSPDSVMPNLLSLFTFLSEAELQEILSKHVESPDLRLAQKILAEQVTLLVHGEKGLHSAELATSALYQSNLEALTQLNGEEIIRLFSGASCCEIQQRDRATVLDLAMEARCFLAENDAKRIISAGGFSINHEKVREASQVLDPAKHILPNGITLLRVGKKNYYIVKWIS